MQESLTDRIKRHEGLILHPKPDAKGMWVIGYGHDITEQEASDYPDGCTLEDAKNWLDSDIEKAQTGVMNALPWVSTLCQPRQDVLTEMAFQIGLHGLLGFHETITYIKAGNYADAASHMLASAWHTQTPTRCEELANIMLTGDENV